MARVVWCLVVLVVVAAMSGSSAAPGARVRRGFGSGYGDSSSGYGRGSDERDASVSEETGCNSGYGRGYSGSRESGYNRDGRSDTRGGRSFARSSAAAVASASAYKINQTPNGV